MRYPLTIASLLVTGVLATGPAALAAVPNPCVLVSTTDALTVLGSAPPAGKAKTVGAVKTCVYTAKKKTLAIEARHVATKAAFEKAVKATGLAFPIHGVGADAFSGGAGKILFVWKNGVQVTFTFKGVNPFVATQQSLAKSALGRL